MEVLFSSNRKIEIKYRRFTLYYFNPNNIKNITRVIHLSKNYFLDLWNSWANNLYEVLFLLSNEADRK
jgi:hypothetical protein